MLKLVLILCCLQSFAHAEETPVPPANPAPSTDPYHKAKVVGSIVGFGSGHVMMGEYMPRGFVYSLTEGVPVAVTALTGVFFFFANETPTYREEHDVDCSRDFHQPECDDGHPGYKPWVRIALVSAGIFSIAKICEISDLWFWHPKTSTGPVSDSGQKPVVVFGEPSFAQSNLRPILGWNIGLKF